MDKLFLISKARCTLTDSSATSPTARLIRFFSAVNGSLSCKYHRIFKPSEWSLVIRVCAASLYWSLVWYFEILHGCEILHSSIYLCHNRHWKKPYCCCLSLIPCPLVNPPDIFRLHIRTCSTTRSGERPAQKWSLLCVTCSPFMKCLH